MLFIHRKDNGDLKYPPVNMAQIVTFEKDFEVYGAAPPHLIRFVTPEGPDIIWRFPSAQSRDETYDQICEAVLSTLPMDYIEKNSQ